MKFIFLILLLMATAFVHAKSGKESGGIIPSAPPVNLHTSATERHYKGYGYLNFSVVLPQKATPEFTLGSDEDAEYDIGDTKFSAHGVVYADNGSIKLERSEEHAWIGGVLSGDIESHRFSRDGQNFSVNHDRNGLFLATRNAVSKRLFTKDRLTLDYNFTSMWSVFYFSGDTRIDSGPVSGQSGRYISDFSETTTGVAYRPMLTLQPTYKYNSTWSIVPFIGATAFLSASYNYWYVNEWEDVLYGKDCFDGCEDSKISFGIIPLEIFVGFDVEWNINKTDTLSLSSFFSAASSTDTESMSELYILYSMAFN